MLIMRFHKLIQSKLVWILFISIIVISFVALQVASDSSPDPAAARLNQSVASIGDREVSFLELDVTKRMISLQTRNPLDAELLEDLALNHLAMVQYAESLGITVDEAFAARQFAMNFTDEQGELDENALNQFRMNIRGTQISEPDYVEFIRQQMIIDQLRQVLAGVILVPEFDVERWAGLQTDEFIVDYAPLGPEILSETIEATEEQVAAYYAENAEQFTLPEERIVRYLVVSANDHSESIEPPTEEDAREVYLAQPEQYTRSVDVPAESEGEEATPQTEPIPFTEVKEDILNNLRAERTEKATRDTAMNLALRMTPRRGRSAEGFTAVAESAGLEIRITEPFSRRTTLEGPANDPGFKQQAFELELSEFGQRGGPLQVENDFIIMELVEILPPRVPELEEVADRVAAVASSVEQRKALAAQAELVAEQLREKIESGSSFVEAGGELELNILTSDPLSLLTLDPRRSMIPNELIRELPAHQAGELIGPIQSQFGGFFVASIQVRTPQPLEKEASIPQLKQMLATQLQFQGLFSRFQDQVIDPMIEKL